jgi:cyclopropane fatty-acyl-phospholipid synthase-like methyltransferase
VAHKLSFRLGEAERLTGVVDSCVDRILAIECAFYFDRPRFYRRAAQVLKPDGQVVLADIAFADRAAFLARRAEDCDGSARNRQTVPNGRGISAHDPCAASITGPGPGRR